MRSVDREHCYRFYGSYSCSGSLWQSELLIKIIHDATYSQNLTSKSSNNIQKPLACVAEWLLKNFQGMVSSIAGLTPCHSLLIAPQSAGLVSMRSSRSSPCGVSACLSPCGWTGSGGGGLPIHSSACKGPFQIHTGSHGSQGTGIPPSCEGMRRNTLWVTASLIFPSS